MPHTINGVGTHYYGKSNVEYEAATCEFCGNFTRLETYETGYFFVVLFIPLIPLGRKQILDYCPSCTQHRALPVKEWQRIREESIDQSTANLSENMENADAAIEHIQTLTAFRQMEEAGQLALAIEGSHADNADAQFFLGAWHEKYGQDADADRCFDRAFEIDPKHEGAVRARGVGLIQKGELDEAREMFQILLPPSESYDATIFIMLATAYQEANRHSEAMELYKLMVDETPEFGKESWLRKSVRNSEKMLGISATESFLPRRTLFGYKNN